MNHFSDYISYKDYQILFLKFITITLFHKLSFMASVILPPQLYVPSEKRAGTHEQKRAEIHK